MHIEWRSLLIVFTVSFASAAAVVLLVGFALVALSGKPVPGSTIGESAISTQRKTIAAVTFTLAAAIVLYGLYVIVST